MTTVEVNGKAETRARAGTPALSLLALPINVFVLLALGGGPRSLVDLRREVGSPPQTTMRRQLRALIEIGVLAKRRKSDFPGSLTYELTERGEGLLRVAEVLRTWLSVRPAGALSLGSVAAKSAITAMVEGWETQMLRALAARPLALTELDKLISALSYPSLERRLAAMRVAGQVEPLPSKARVTPYAVTDWLRRAMAPLAAAARWEMRHLDDSAAPVGSRDTETSLLLVAPLLRLPSTLSGSCRLVVDIGRGDRRRLAGVMVAADRGRISSCTTRLEGNPDAWVGGPFGAWLGGMIDLDHRRLEIGGDGALAVGLLEGLHRALFGRKPAPNASIHQIASRTS